MAVGIVMDYDAVAESERNPESKHHNMSDWVWRMSELTRDETAEPVSRDRILRRERSL